MNQVADILKLAIKAKQQGIDAVLATVVRTEGSAYRRAGAMMLICEDGRSVGMISGGCLEPHIIKRAFWLTRNGANVQVYQTGDDIKYADDGQAQAGAREAKSDIYDEPDSNLNSGLDDDLDDADFDELNFGLGCNGRVHVLFERLTTATPLLETIRNVRRTQQPITVATLIRVNDYQHQDSITQNSDNLQTGMRINLDEYRSLGSISAQGKTTFSSILANTVEELAQYKLSDKNAEYVIVENGKVTTEWLVQSLQPQLRLLICGAGNDVMPLVTMAKLQDWHVTVIDSRAQYATRMRFPQADVVMSLSLKDSEALLELSDNAAVALMSHSLSQDRARLAILLEHPDNYKYLGQLGPRYRTERLIDEISMNVSNPIILEAGIHKLYYPIGYKLGGDGPEALALGIMAEINAVMYNQTAPVEFSKNHCSDIAETSSDAECLMNSRTSIEDTERQMQNHAVIVLASGLSQRLGQPKQMLFKDGEPLIACMTRLALSTNPQAIVVVIPDNHRLIASGITELADQHPAVQIVVNLQPDTGMADSLRLGIETIANFESASIDRVLIMGVDQILLDESHLTALLAGKKAVVASSYHSWQSLEKCQIVDKVTSNKTPAANESSSDIIGLPLVINSKLLRQLQPELIGDKGLRHLIRGLPANQIGKVDNDQLSYDIDTPEQLAYAKQQGWLDE